MAGVVEEIIKNKEEIIEKVITLLEGKETNTSLNLDNIKFTIAKNIEVTVDGKINFTITPIKKKK